MINQKNPLGRHSGAGRNPAIINTPRSGQDRDVVPLTWGFVNHLDTGLRRYDAVFSNGLLGIKCLMRNGMTCRFDFRSKMQKLFFCCLTMTVVGCTSVVVQQPPVADDAKVVRVETAPVPAPAPTVIAVSPATVADGTLSIVINGEGFDNNTVAELYDSSGKHVWSGNLSGKHLTVDAKTIKHEKGGNYTLKLRNQNGQYSKAIALVVPTQKPKPAIVKLNPVPPKQAECENEIANKPNVLYLGGGDATKLFERYLAKNSEVESRLSYTFKVKFYSKSNEASEPSLQTAALGDMEQMFVESPDDFLDKLRKQMKGKVAEYVATLAEDAKAESADYFQCQN
jgi:hypothetical protein